MGQKVSPIGLRIGINKDWESKWFAPNKDFKKYLQADLKIRKYLDKELKTFAFEISTKNNVGNDGWLTSKISKTTHYMIIYPRSRTNSIENLSSIESYLISKEKIKTFIKMCGIDISTIAQEMEKIPPESSGRSYMKCKNFVKCVYSRNITPEQPINILIPKNTLKILAEKKFFVTYEVNEWKSFLRK